jgi:hypothetical protein
VSGFNRIQLVTLDPVAAPEGLDFRSVVISAAKRESVFIGSDDSKTSETGEGLAASQLRS